MIATELSAAFCTWPSKCCSVTNKGFHWLFYNPEGKTIPTVPDLSALTQRNKAPQLDHSVRNHSVWLCVRFAIWSKLMILHYSGKRNAVCHWLQLLTASSVISAECRLRLVALQHGVDNTDHIQSNSNWRHCYVMYTATANDCHNAEEVLNTGLLPINCRSWQNV